MLWRLEAGGWRLEAEELGLFTSCRSNEGSQTTRGTKYSLERGYDRRQERDNHYHSKDSVGRQTRSFRAETEGRSFRHEAQRPLRRRQLNSEREWGENSRRKDHRSLSQRSHSYYQGIAKPREDIRREDSNSSKHQHGSTRGVPLEEKAHDHISKEAVETSMGELQDVINLYSSCTDPIESATRKDRVSSPEQGDQSQERIPATQRLSLPLSTDFSQERIPATQRLSIGPQPEAEQERVHVALRLGPTNADTVQGANQEIDTTVKRKPGRPPADPRGRNVC
ncbi:hypothetical protein Bca101_075089 [Brassica carinata]